MKSEVDLRVYFGGWVGGAWMSLGVSDNVLLEAHNDDPQNSQHPKLMAWKMLLAKIYGVIVFGQIFGKMDQPSINGRLNVDKSQILDEKLMQQQRAKECGEPGGENSES